MALEKYQARYLLEPGILSRRWGRPQHAVKQKTSSRGINAVNKLVPGSLVAGKFGERSKDQGVQASDPGWLGLLEFSPSPYWSSEGTDRGRQQEG